MVPRRCFLLGSIVLAAAACSEPTEVVINIDSALGVPCQLDSVRLEVTPIPSGQPVVREFTVRESNVPGSLVVVSTSGSSDSVEVRAVGSIDGVAVSEVSAAATFEDGGSRELNLAFLPECTPSSPCDQSGRTSVTPLTQISCDIDRYAVAEDNLVPQTNACATPDEELRFLESSDGAEVAIPFDGSIPFAFLFYGEAVNTIHVSDNGYLSLSQTAPNVADLPPQALDAPDAPELGIMPFWDRLATSAEGVCSIVQGNAPSRTLWVTWSRACFAGAAGCAGEDESLTFTVGLEETTNRVLMTYPSMSAVSPAEMQRAEGFTASIGIKGRGAARCPANMCNAGGTCMGSGDPCGYTQYRFETAAPLQSLIYSPAQ